MITLQGKNLCERHKELNLKVKEAAQNKVDLQEVISAPELSDVDRLFKIDLASKYKDIDYIIEQLKCGDTLYISRALKCEWIYGNEYDNIINPDYLHQNIFPKMSSKMKKKTLSTISIHVRDEIRAQLFYEYCSNANMTEYAYKFLIFTSESFKKDFLSDKVNFRNIQYEPTCIKLIGNSFVLADTYGKMGGLVKRLANMYSVNETEFLNLYEKYTTPLYYVPKFRVGAKMSRSILKKHKSRVLKDPPLYLSMLKNSEVLKYSSSEDAKVYAKALLPKNVQDFWFFSFAYKHIFDLIKTDKYTFIKKIFHEQYPSEELEMNEKFYRWTCYDFMNDDEKETWALMNLKQLGVVPEDQKYRLYELVRFSKAFEEIKKQVLITFDLKKKYELLNILVKAAKTPEDIEKLLNYYYESHFYAEEKGKRDFIRNVSRHHNVFDFDDACWHAFDKILNSLGLYVSMSQYDDLLEISIVYHITTKKAFPYDLSNYMHRKFYYSLKFSPFDKLSEVKRNLVYDFFLKFYLNKIAAFECQDYNDSVKNEVREYLSNLSYLRYYFGDENDYPSIALKFMNLDFEYFKHKLEKNKVDITEGYLIRCLKKEPTLIIEQFPLIEQKMQDSNDVRFNMFLKKLKVYFSSDLARQYLDLCSKSLFNISPFMANYKQRLIRANVFAIFQIGDECIKKELMDNHKPSRKKINLETINDYVYFTQLAICRFHCYSRPPVPLSKTRLYLKGDYLHECREMFRMYLANLEPAALTEFIKLLLISSVPAQKQGVWLAFQISKTSGKKNLVSTVWMKLKNVETLRKNLYKIIIDKIRKDKSEHKLETFEVLRDLTCHVNEDDAEVFKYLRGNEIPDYLRGAYLESAWKAVSALQDDDARNIRRRTRVMNAMESNMSLLDDVFAKSIINDYFQKKWLNLKWSPGNDPNPAVAQLNDATCNFVVEYIVNIPNDDKQEKSMELVKEVTDVCFSHWNVKYDEDFSFQLFFMEFVNKLDAKALYSGTKYSRVTHIFEYLLKSLEDRFDITEIYSYFWDLQLLLLTRKAINGIEECDKEVHIGFGSELGKFVKKLKEKNCYFTSFLQKNVGKLSRFTEILSKLRTPPLTDRYVKILVAYGLTLHNMFETFVLALEILPQNLSRCSVNETELREIIKMIKRQNNSELTALMNDKFVYSGVKERKLM